MSRYQLGARLGSGGVAEVHRALDRHTGQAVAIKHLLPQLAEDRAMRLRFLREAEVARTLDHPAVVRVLDAGDDDGRPFLTMELVEGEDLRRHLDRRGRLGWPEAAAIALPVARALDHAHQRGVIHRDVKPHNVLGATTTPKLGDFGLARLESLAGLTGSSVVWGSPEYMAPELFGRGRADPRSDLYSLGVMLFEMVTGALPWKDHNRALARLALSESDRPASLPPSGLGGAWDALFASLLAPSPALRPASAAVLIAALESGPARELAPRSTSCSACGAARPDDIPRCFTCGHQEITRTRGAWAVLLTGMKDDAETMTAIQQTLGTLTGRDDLRLKFVLGDRRLYSSEEAKDSITLPATLFSGLSHESAEAIRETLGRGEVKLRIADHARQGLRRVAGACAATVGAAVAAGGAFTSIGFLTVTGLAGLVAGVAFYRSQRDLGANTHFRLREPGAPAAASTPLLEAARTTSATLAAPEARALFTEAAQELFRLGRRAEALTREAAPGSSEEALARRFLAAAPALSARFEALTRELDRLDQALGDGGEGDSVRALATLERRLAGASAADRPALLDARRDIEASLERRHRLSAEREALAATICGQLGTLRDLFRHARQLTTPEERETAAAAAALNQLETDLSERAPAAALLPSG